MPATAAAAAAGARATRSCARSTVGVPRRVHVRAHAAIGTTAQPSSPSACRLLAGPISSVLSSIRHG
eukprot:4130381-Prymnesium_polylepis.1